MKVNWDMVSIEAPRLKDLRPGQTFVIPGNDGLYIRTSSSHIGDFRDLKIGVTNLETGGNFYMNEGTCVTPVEGSFVPDES